MATLSIGSRESFQANALRARGLPSVVEGERLRNLINLHIQNKNDTANTYLIEVADDAGPALEVIVPQPSLQLPGLQDGQTPVFLYLARAAYDGPFPVHVTVTDSSSGQSRRLKVTFRGP
ncbi:hypothetical protein H8E07_21265 [bacterium]|nr:hypothetical protein [bacterium]